MDGPQSKWSMNLFRWRGPEFKQWSLYEAYLLLVDNFYVFETCIYQVKFTLKSLCVISVSVIIMILTPECHGISGPPRPPAVCPGSDSCSHQSTTVTETDIAIREN